MAKYLLLKHYRGAPASVNGVPVDQWTPEELSARVALAGLDPALPRHNAVAAYLHERDGDPVTAARLYAEAARSAPNVAERDHLTRQAARLNAQLHS